MFNLNKIIGVALISLTIVIFAITFTPLKIMDYTILGFLWLVWALFGVIGGILLLKK